ncbi:MAG: cation:proton antiporter [Bacteroidetes bacterium]|nr:cation:proton antiporter [Bacteroidota bacterium]
MTTTIIIFICVLLLLAYLFEITSAITKVPTVLFLLLLGWLVRQSMGMMHIAVPDLSSLLSVFGTIGLILIVLEGSLELELHKSKLPMIGKSAIIAVISLLVMSLFLAYLLHFTQNVEFKIALANAIPLCVVSSAIAIPSSRGLQSENRQTVIYESSLSDILGVLFFNFIVLNETIDAGSFGNFFIQLLLIIVISFLAVAGLAFILSRIKHHVTFTPIILLVILIYYLSKLYHLPGLVFILVFGLFLGNLEVFKKFNWIKRLRPHKLDVEVQKFKRITIEATFLIRTLFFMMFGFMMNLNEIMNLNTLPWAVMIVVVGLLIRWGILRWMKMPVNPLLFLSPKGLITILLFLSIPASQNLPLVNKSLVIQVIVISILTMTYGIMKREKTIIPEEEYQSAK